MSLSEKHISYLCSLHGWCIPHKMNRLYDLVIEANQNLSNDEALVICEAGVYAGRSLFPMAIACKDLGKGMVWGIEAWSNEVAIEGEEISAENTAWWGNLDMNLIFNCFLKTIDFLGLQDYITYHRAKSYESAHLFPDNSLSVLHLDSNHNTFAIIRELDAFTQKVKVGGFLVVDDSDWPSVQEAYAKIPDYGFELLETNNVEVPRTQPQQFTEYKVFKKVR